MLMIGLADAISAKNSDPQNGKNPAGEGGVLRVG
jgi:hypothetical protein